MCGIVGVIQIEDSGLSDDMFKLFQEMLITDQVRGAHGTGIFSVGEDGAARYVKMAGTPTDLYRAEAFGEFWKEAKKTRSRMLIGHNRYATTGSHDTKNAHPFMHGNICMIHNGTLEKYRCDDMKFHKYDVDSEALCAAIAEKGIEKAITNTAGAWAIIYFDQEKKSLHILRNSERPLYYQRVPFWNRIILASEEQMLKWHISRNFLSNEPTYAVPTDTLVTIPLAGKLDTKGKTCLHTEQKAVVGKSQLPKTSGSGLCDTGGWSAYPMANGKAQILHPPFKTKKQKKLEKKANLAQVEKEIDEAKKRNSEAPPPPIPASGNIVTNRGTYRGVNGLLGIVKEQMIVFRMMDMIQMNTDETDPVKKRYRIVGKCTKLQPANHAGRIRFMFYVCGEQTVDDLFSAGYIKAKVNSIMMDLTPNRPESTREDIIWVSNAEPVFESTGQIVNLV